MKLINDFTTSVKKAFDEIDPQWDSYPGLVVCGTHSQVHVDSVVEEIRRARESKLPSLLICSGHQMGAIQWARDNGIPDATSEEYGFGTFVVKKRPEMKVGLHDGETWWSNYEVVIDWEIPDHFISVPYHPEYRSSIDNPHPLLLKFINNCRKHAMVS